jgi:hypothetical protein
VAGARRVKGAASFGAPLSESPAEPLPVGSPRELLAAVMHRLLHPRTVVLETRRPVEVPVITETKRLWVLGDRPAAVRYAYESSLADVERAFQVHFPADWTHEDILERGTSPEMGSVPDFLVQLLRLYEPIRYGGTDVQPGRSPEPLLQSIYAHPKMWGLYIAAVPATPDGGTPAPATAATPQETP